MSITDGVCASADLDTSRDAVLVVINASTQQQSVQIDAAVGQNIQLHSLHREVIVNVSNFAIATGSFSIPPRTTAVFEQLQSTSQGEGLPCNN